MNWTEGTVTVGVFGRHKKPVTSLATALIFWRCVGEEGFVQLLRAQNPIPLLVPLRAPQNSASGTSKDLASPSADLRGTAKTRLGRARVKMGARFFDEVKKYRRLRKKTKSGDLPCIISSTFPLYTREQPNKI